MSTPGRVFVVRTAVHAGRIRGALFVVKGATDAPGVVVLGGSDGGNLYEFVAALLAAHGIAALALAYFAYDDLPKELIGLPIEYFGEGVQWLGKRPEAAAWAGADGSGIRRKRAEQCRRLRGSLAAHVTFLHQHLAAR